MLPCSHGVAAAKPLSIDVWPGKPADDEAGKIGEEKFFELKVGGKPYEVGGKPTAKIPLSTFAFLL